MLAHDFMTIAGSRAGCIDEESRGVIDSAGEIGYVEGTSDLHKHLCENVLKSAEGWLE